MRAFLAAVLCVALTAAPLSAQPICDEVKADAYRLKRSVSQLTTEYPGTMAVLFGCIGATEGQDPMTRLGTCIAACAVFVTLSDCTYAGRKLGELFQEKKRLDEANREFSCNVYIN